MDLARLAASTVLASFDGPSVPDWLSRHVDGGLGGVCLFGSNLAGGAAPIAAALHDGRPDVLVALDEEGGEVTRLELASGSSLPGNAALGAVDDIDLTREAASALGALLHHEGVDLDLAPVADVNSVPTNPVIGVRSFGTDAELVGRHVAAFIRGLQDVGVAACAKHFPGHGATDVDSHLALPRVDAPVALLRRRELVPFRHAAEAGAAAIMTAHLLVPALDGEPATVSTVHLVDVLRGELGFDGAVVTDALDMDGIGGTQRIPATLVQALAAGADLCCLGPAATVDLVDACIAAVVQAVRDGRLTEARLADAGARVAGIARGVATAPSGAPARSLAAVGADAAARAVRVEGRLALDGAELHVVELERPPMIAAGPVPLGFVDLLALPAVTAERLGDHGDTTAAIGRAIGRRLVVVARDAERHKPQARHLAQLCAARPDAIVIDIGWPSRCPSPGAARITTYGATPASAAAVAALLAPVRSHP